MNTVRRQLDLEDFSVLFDQRCDGALLPCSAFASGFEADPELLPESLRQQPPEQGGKARTPPHPTRHDRLRSRSAE